MLSSPTLKVQVIFYIIIIQNFSLTPEDGGVLNPHEKIDLTLTFCPKSIGKVAAKLNIKVLTEEDEIIEIFTIPIKGETLDLPISVSGK